MADIASLGLAVDSSQVDKGKLSLDQLSNAAKRAQAANDGLAVSSKNASAAAVAAARSAYQESVAKTAAARAAENASRADIQSAMAAQRKAREALEVAKADHARVAAANAAATAAARDAAAALKAAAAHDAEAAAAQKAAGAMNASATAMNDNVRRMGGSMSGLAAQFQDIGVTAAMDMNPMVIALQQGTQIAGQLEAAVQGGGSAVSVLGEALKSLFSPLTLVTIVLTALAAAGLQMVDWAGVSATLFRGLADVLEPIAPYAAMAAAGLALLYAPAIIGGVVSLIALMGRLAVSAGIAAAAMAAANPAAALILGITAAVAAANIFRDELTQTFGVDVVGAAKTGANYVIGSFVAAFEDLKFVWNQFPNIVGAAAVGAANAALSAMESMINSASGMLNGLISSMNSALASLPGGFQIGEIGQVDFGQFGNPFADALTGAVADRNAAVQGALSRDYLGEFGTAIASGASKASAKLQELAGSLGGVKAKTKEAKAETERLAERYNDILLDAEGFIASQMAEKDALLLTEQAANALRYEQDLLNQAMQAGIKIDVAKAAELKSYAAAMASAEAETGRMRGALDSAQDVSRGFFEDFAGGLRQGEGLWKSFADAAVNALDKVASKLLDSGLDMLFGGGSTGGFGILGSILGFGGGSDPWAGLRGYAEGTASARAGVAMVGERGPELVRFRGGEQVVPNHMLGRVANNNQPVAANFNFAPVVSIQGGGGDSSEEVTKALKRFADKEFTPRVAKALREIKTRGMA